MRPVQCPYTSCLFFPEVAPLLLKQNLEWVRSSSPVPPALTFLFLHLLCLHFGVSSLTPKTGEPPVASHGPGAPHHDTTGYKINLRWGPHIAFIFFVLMIETHCCVTDKPILLMTMEVCPLPASLKSHSAKWASHLLGKLCW